MNKEEGERALSEAYKRISSNNIHEALKYLKISHRLFPTPQTEALIARYSNTSSTSSTSHSSHTSSSSNFPSSTTSTSTSSSHFSSTNSSSFSSSQFLSSPYLRNLRDQLNILIDKFLFLESKYVLPSMRNYIRGLFLLIFILFIIKFVFRRKIGFGLLPGDISYSTSNTYFYFPVISMV